MDLVPLKTESTISGAFSYILGLSRIFGIAPLKFERVCGGWRISVATIYCFHVYALVVVLSMIFFIIMDATSSLLVKGHGIVNVLNILILGILIFTGVITGTKRVRHLIDTIEKLKQINEELTLCSQSFLSTSQIKIWLLIITYSILVTANSSVQVGVFVNDIITKSESVWVLCFYLAYCGSSVITGLLFLQFTLSTILVLTTFIKLNEYLKDLLQKIYNNASATTTLSSSLHKPTLIKTTKPFNLFTRAAVQKSFTSDYNSKAINVLEGLHNIPTSVHRCALIYCCLCGFIRRLNNDNGFILVLMFLSFLLYLISTPYNIILKLANTSFDLLKILLECSWLIYHSSKLLLMVEPCHRTYEQIDLTRSLINQMKRYTLPGDYAVISELKMFQRHLMLNQVSYSPLQLFTLNRSILVTVLGSVITYLVIVLQQ